MQLLFDILQNFYEMPFALRKFLSKFLSIVCRVIGTFIMLFWQPLCFLPLNKKPSRL